MRLKFASIWHEGARSSVSSLPRWCFVAGLKISIKKKFKLEINGEDYESYALFYPVGNGRFNQHKAVEDIKEILK